jgi:hypothetical protein
MEMPLIWKTQSSFPQSLGKAQSRFSTFPQLRLLDKFIKKKRRKTKDL